MTWRKKRGQPSASSPPGHSAPSLPLSLTPTPLLLSLSSFKEVWALMDSLLRYTWSLCYPSSSSKRLSGRPDGMTGAHPGDVGTRDLVCVLGSMWDRSQGESREARGKCPDSLSNLLSISFLFRPCSSFLLDLEFPYLKHRTVSTSLWFRLSFSKLTCRGL